MASTLAHLQRLGPDELAEVLRATDDELADAARHIAQLIALREQAKCREAELAARPTLARRVEIAASASSRSSAGRVRPARGG
jgi:acyl-CoA reductase-like NAD-dependent aldehyde dehydrogenase